MGAILRKITNNCTMVHNEYLNDPRLGGYEMGWLTFMLSRPDNWDFSMDDLVRRQPDSKTRIMTTLNKLKSFGYLRQIKLVDSKTGLIVDWVYEFSDEAHPEWIGNSPVELV